MPSADARAGRGSPTEVTYTPSVAATVSDIDGAPHPHAVAFYDHDDDLVAQVAGFVGDGLFDVEVVVVVATGDHLAGLGAALEAEGIDVDAARDSGRYVTFDAAETLAHFDRDGVIDPATFESLIGGILADAGRSGLRVRVFGEMVALLWERGAAAAAIRLEELWNELATRYDFALLCAYPVAFLDDGDLAAAASVCGQHSHLVAPASYLSPGAEATPTPDAVTAAFVPVPSAVRAARRFATRTLGAWNDDDLIGDTSLIVSELATNAVLHASSPFRLSMNRSASSLRITVEDATPVAPVPRHPPADEPGGRGLGIVDRLSARWGTTVHDHGKVVWSEIDAGLARY